MNVGNFVEKMCIKNEGGGNHVRKRSNFKV